jgi:hypothetical protein
MEELNTLDKATLRFWRATNVIGWSVLGIYLANTIHLLGLQLFSFYESAGFKPTSYWTVGALGVGATVRMLVKRVVMAAAAGGVIGLIVGRKVAWHPARVTVSATTIYLVVTMVVYEFSGWSTRLLQGDDFAPNSLGRSALQVAVSATAIGWSWFCVRQKRAEVAVGTRL